VIGGFVIGVLENVAGVYLGGEWKGVLAFVVIAALLCLRPAGLLGEAEPAR
jgi:branched-chain amino acid transport system permease protein